MAEEGKTGWKVLFPDVSTDLLRAGPSPTWGSLHSWLTLGGRVRVLECGLWRGLRI